MHVVVEPQGVRHYVKHNGWKVGFFRCFTDPEYENSGLGSVVLSAFFMALVGAVLYVGVRLL